MSDEVESVLGTQVDGATHVAGANVTTPHKTEGAERLEVPSDAARRLRAVNTIVVGPGGLEGHNTDAPGFDRFLRRDAAFDPSGRSAPASGRGRAAGLVPLPRLGRAVVVVDLLSHPTTTPLLSAAREAGASAFGGLGLLLEQAELSFEAWAGQAAPVG